MPARATSELRFLMANDPDPFVRWEAGHSYATRLMLALIGARAAGRRADCADPGLADAFAATLAAPALERAFVAQALVLPAESFVGEQMAVIDVDGIHAVRELLRKTLGRGAAGAVGRDLCQLPERRALQHRGRGDRPARAEEHSARLSGRERLRAGRRLVRGAVREGRQHDRSDRGAGPAGGERSARAGERAGRASTTAGGAMRW